MKEQRAKSKELRAKSKELRAKSKELRAKSKEGSSMPYALCSKLYALCSMPYALCLVLWFVPIAYAGAIGEAEQSLEPTRPSQYEEGKTTSLHPGQVWESRYYLIEGVHYLLNEGDRDIAEELFRKAILSSPFSSLSKEAENQDQNRPIVAEAFYFLGKIHYERAEVAKSRREGPYALSSMPYAQNIAWAKKYLRKAEEYGIVYDRLHPPLLAEINQRYPEIEVSISEPNRDEVATRHAVSVLMEIGDGSYRINAIKVDQYADITEIKFLTNREFDLESGARYKLKPDVQGGHRSMYRVLAVLGIGLVVWLTRG